MSRRNLAFVLAGLVVALLLGGGMSHYASGDPDGLNKVAEDTGFASAEREHAAGESPLAGYSASGVDNERLSGGLAVGSGVLVCFAVGGALFWAVRRRSEPAGDGG